MRALRWIGVVLIGAALVATGCGSDSGQAEDDASPTPTPTATATATADGAELDQLPEVPEATTSTRPPESTDGTGGSAFLTAVFDDAQAMWRDEFQAAGIPYAPARITIFRDEVDTACGTQSASVGPFYCPADSGVYLDRRFFDALSRLELQADCFAGIWKHSRYEAGQLRQEDFEDALRAAAVVGSDFQQQLATGTIRPEDWTHGSSRQRQHWLTTGFEQGRPGACDTFATGA